MRWLLSLFFLAFAGVCSALSAAGNRLLVVLEEQELKDKYKTFFSDLQERGYEISTKSPKDESLSLFHLGDRAYDHILLFPPKSKAYGPSLSPNTLLEFSKAKGNILLGLSANTPTPTAISSLLLELDIQLPADRTSLVVDHFNFDQGRAADKHDVLVVPPPKQVRKDVRNFFEGKDSEPIAVPHAVGHVLGASSPLLAPILRSPSTAYSYNPKDEDAASGIEDIFASGAQLGLVSAIQGRNSARFTVLGSIELLADEWFDAKVKTATMGKALKTGNRRFAQQLTQWTFMEVGVLKVGLLRHFAQSDSGKVDNSSSAHSILNPGIYRIGTDVTYQIALSEFSQNHWVPFHPPTGDAVQLEFSMLSPFHRIDLSPVPPSQNTDSTATLYQASFKVPDQHGIFNFHVTYNRPFYTNVEEKRQVTVRHNAHDEWPRSYVISGAWTWVAGIWITVLGWLAFVAIWLWSKPVNEEGALKKRQ